MRKMLMVGLLLAVVATFAVSTCFAQAMGMGTMGQNSMAGQHNMQAAGHTQGHGSGHGTHHGSGHGTGHGSGHGSGHGTGSGTGHGMF